LAYQFFAGIAEEALCMLVGECDPPISPMLSIALGAASTTARKRSSL
jgi:hypothetical protein